MAAVYGTLSFKGGAGKSTLATIIAGEYASYDKSVLLIDTDPSQNLAAWWKLSAEKENQPEFVDFASVLQRAKLDDLVERARSNYDVVIIDTAGRDSVFGSSIIEHSDIVLTPVQPSKCEIDAAGQAAELVSEFNASSSRQVTHLMVRTRISVTNRNLEAYRFIREFSAALQSHGLDSKLLDTELFERNVYRDILNGHGSVQMQELTDTIKKARTEIWKLVHEIETYLPTELKRAA